MAKRKVSYVDVVDLGKTPPNAVDLEANILGCLMAYPDSFVNVSHILSVETFFNAEHQEIYRSIENVYKEKDTCDRLLVVTDLEKRGELERVGGVVYITKLSSGVVSDANIGYWAKTVLDKFILREQIRMGISQVNEAFDPNASASDIIQSAARNSDYLSTMWITKTSVARGSGAVDECMTDLKKRCENYDNGVLNGIPTGFFALDRLTNGWQKSDLIVLAGRPGQGKTSCALAHAVACAKAGSPVKIFSLEMSRLQLMYKLLAEESGVDPNNIRRGSLRQMEWIQLRIASEVIKRLPIDIDDTPGVTPEYIYATSKLDASKGKCSLVIIDYLQLISHSESGKSTADNIGYVTRRCKALAKSADIPVILLSQLSRKVEERPGKKPALSDLRDSGEIEANADIAIFVYRPEYYGLVDKDGEPIVGRGSLLVEKHRGGPCGDIRFRYNEWMSRLWDTDGVGE